MMKPVVFSLAAVALLSSCATLKLTEQGEKVRVLEPSEVASCRSMGRTNASVTAKIIFDRQAAPIGLYAIQVAGSGVAGKKAPDAEPLVERRDRREAAVEPGVLRSHGQPKIEDCMLPDNRPLRSPVTAEGTVP